MKTTTKRKKTTKNTSLKKFPERVHPESFAAHLPLFESLVKKRSEISKKQRVPAYRVFTDETLRLFSIHRPRTDLEMLEIKGVGPKKLKKYAKVFQELINPPEEQYKLL